MSCGNQAYAYDDAVNNDTPWSEEPRLNTIHGSMRLWCYGSRMYA